MPRIAPVTSKSDVPAEYHGVVDDVLKVFGAVRGPFSIMLHSPKLAERVLPLVTFFREGSVVEAKLRSHAIGAARRAGVPESTLDLLRAKADPSSLPEDERDIVIYTRQLMRTNRVDEAVLERLRNRHGVQWVVELTAAVNYFSFLSGMVNAFEVPVPPDGDKLPS